MSAEEEQTPATDPPAEGEESAKTGADEGTEGEAKGEATTDADGKYTRLFCLSYSVSLLMIYICLSIV